MADPVTQKNRPTVEHKAPEGFIEVKLDLPSFKPELFTRREPGTNVELYTGDPLQGVVTEFLNFGVRHNPDGSVQVDGDGVPKEIEAIVVKLEAPLKCISRDKQIVEGRVGDEILLFMTARLYQAFTKATRHPVSVVGNHPTNMIRIWCLPTKRTPMPNDDQKKLWDYKFQVHPTPVKRAGAQQLGAHFAPPQIAQTATPAANGAGAQA